MLKGTAIRDTKWHAKHLKRIRRRERVRKLHDFFYRAGMRDKVETYKAEEEYQKARERERQKRYFFLIRWVLKLKWLIKKIWNILKKLQKTKTEKK